TPHGEVPAVLVQPAAPTAHITDEPNADHVHGGSDEQDCEHAEQCPHSTATEWRFALHDRVHSQFRRPPPVLWISFRRLGASSWEMLREASLRVLWRSMMAMGAFKASACRTSSSVRRFSISRLSQSLSRAIAFCAS